MTVNMGERGVEGRKSSISAEGQKRTGVCPQVATRGSYGELRNKKLKVERKVF